MDYAKEIDKLISAGEEAIKASPDLRELLYRIYSDLFLETGVPQTCGSKISLYFSKVMIDGKEKAKQYEDVSNRTVVFRASGKVYLSKMGASVNLNLLTDKQAVDYYNKGWLSLQAFNVLPNGYELVNNKLVKKEEKKDFDDEMKELEETVKTIKRSRKKKA